MCAKMVLLTPAACCRSTFASAAPGVFLIPFHIEIQLVEIIPTTTRHRAEKSDQHIYFFGGGDVLVKLYVCLSIEIITCWRYETSVKAFIINVNNDEASFYYF